MLTTMRNYAVILIIFATLAAMLTSIVYWLTAPIIHNQILVNKKNQLNLVLPPRLYDNDIQQNCYVVTQTAGSKPQHIYIALSNHQPIAAAIESTATNGYSGNINLLIGADFYGNVFGVRVLEHHETPGLGDKIETRISNWILSFSGKTVNSHDDGRWQVKKEGGQFDQFTGATITPRAIIHAVRDTVLYLKENKELIQQLPRCEQ